MRVRKLKKSRFLYLVIFIVLFIFIRTLLVTIFGLFEIRTVLLQGDPAFLSNITFFQQKRNLLTLDSTAFKKEILNLYPLIADVSIEKRLPNTLFVQVEPRVPIVFIESAEGIAFLDATGKIIPHLPQFEKYKTVELNCATDVLEVGQTISNEAARKAIQVAAQVIHHIDSSVDSINCIEGQNAVLIRTTEVDVIAPADKNEELASSLQFLLKQFRIDGNWPKVVDMRFEKPVLISEIVQEASPSSEAGKLE